MSKKPVVVYGASGYTGRLVCEFLREYQLPFIAAGRNKARIEEAMAKVPGIETADYEVVEVEHSVAALTELFSGRQVVCNTVGPFEYYGSEVVEAALAANCHYTDTTGEQSFLLEIREKFGALYAEKDLVLSPSVAYMFTPLDIAAHMVLEHGDIDTIDAGCLAAGVPTYASTQTIFAMFKADQFYLENRELVHWEKGRGYEMSVPGKVMTQLAHPWGGGTLPVWFLDQPQVLNVRQVTAFTNRAMYEQLIQLQQHYEANIKDLPEDEQAAALKTIAEEMQPGMPPRENRLVQRTTDFVHGIGTGVHRSCTIYTAAPYQLTGVIQAAFAARLINGGPDRAGFVSACQAVGYRYMLGAIKSFLPVQVEQQ